ncbi:MAG: hypothetical protein ACT4P1_15790 [Sporichthyaceae bacterium]
MTNYYGPHSPNVPNVPHGPWGSPCFDFACPYCRRGPSWEDWMRPNYLSSGRLDHVH